MVWLAWLVLRFKIPRIRGLGARCSFLSAATYVEITASRVVLAPSCTGM